MSCSVQMERWNGMVVDINATCMELGPKCPQLPGMHALSGWYTVSYPMLWMLSRFSWVVSIARWGWCHPCRSYGNGSAVLCSHKWPATQDLYEWGMLQNCLPPNDLDLLLPSNLHLDKQPASSGAESSPSNDSVVGSRPTRSFSSGYHPVWWEAKDGIVIQLWYWSCSSSGSHWCHHLWLQSRGQIMWHWAWQLPSNKCHVMHHLLLMYSWSHSEGRWQRWGI